MATSMSPVNLSAFKGDDEGLLDQLVVSCQKATEKPHLPGHGRVLVPYFGVDNTTLEELPSRSAKIHPSSGSGPSFPRPAASKGPSASGQHPKPAPPTQPGHKRNKGKASSELRLSTAPTPTVPCGAGAPKQGKARAGSSTLPRSSSHDKALLLLGQPRAAPCSPPPPSPVTQTGVGKGFAGPGYCCSPVPTALPMPASLLADVRGAASPPALASVPGVDAIATGLLRSMLQLQQQRANLTVAVRA